MHAVGADQRVAADALAIGERERDAVTVIREADATRIEPDRVPASARSPPRSARVQVGAMHHEVRRAVARDRLGAEIEQLPGLARVPQPDLLAGRLAPDLARSRRSSPSANSTRAPFAEICTPAPSSASCAACS